MPQNEFLSQVHPHFAKSLPSICSRKQILSRAKFAAIALSAIALFHAAALTSAQAQELTPEYRLGGGIGDPVKAAPRHLPGSVVIPASSKALPEDRGKRAHTNLRFIAPSTESPFEAPPYPGYGYETPASLACVYDMVKPIPGCNPNSTTATPTGGSQSIAIVDAYDDPNAAADLAYFSAQFGLPFKSANFQVVYASGSQPPVDPSGGWELEESLDIEYAHAMAPKAKIYLVEANSSYFSDLFGAVEVATNLVQCGSPAPCSTITGKGEVSMSWGGGEFPEEVNLDPLFSNTNVVYFAASGDSAGTIYPCVSPNVVCVGGTSTARSPYSGDLIAEIAWSDAGGGQSYFEAMPSYQAKVAEVVQGTRGVPDVSADANPNTGVWIWDSFPYEGYDEGWIIVGGTSASTPTFAGIVNVAGLFMPSSAAELALIYRHMGDKLAFNDITYGACGYYSGTFSSTGYDLCTGVGSPDRKAGK